jgi:hypothetical protein
VSPLTYSTASVPGRASFASFSWRPWRAVGIVALLAACGDATAPPRDAIPDRPADARFVTTDVENFWRAYDAGGAGASAAIFQSEYLDKASPGLRDFISARNITATSLVQMVRAYPRYFADIQSTTRRLTGSGEPTILARIRAGYERIESLYPAAIFPPVTFLIGRFSTGGTIRESGILIGTELYGGGPATPTDELPEFQRQVVQPLDSIPVIVAHEHVHVLQARAQGLLSKPAKTLLDQALLEGSADFVGELVSGSNINAWLLSYAEPREAALWDEFKREMTGTDISRWLYNRNTGTAERPGDLGYFVGYQITKAYYERAVDKTAALREIVEMRDGATFLAASGYDGGR